VWWLDLRRPWGLGQYSLKTEPIDDVAHFALAIHESWEKLLLERSAAELTTRQMSLLESGPTVDQAVDRWLAEKADAAGCAVEDFDRYTSNCADRIRARWKGTPIRHLSGRQGTALLRKWRDEQAAEGPDFYAPKTRRNTFGVTMQILRWARGDGLISELPDKPTVCIKAKGETLASPDQPTISEEEFRAIREELFGGGRALRVSEDKRHFVDAEAAADYVARRRLYVSWAFYSGMRVIDLNALTADSVSADFGNFRRTSTKNRAPVRVFEVPEQLKLDMRDELRRLGRAWRPGEKICGGPWLHGARVVGAAARRLGIGHRVDFRSVFRRSTVYELALRGWSEQQCADYLGHVDANMVHEVYLTVPPGWPSPIKIAWDRKSFEAFKGKRWTSRAEILPFEASAPHRGGLRLHAGGRAADDDDEIPA
jgi:integrase